MDDNPIQFLSRIWPWWSMVLLCGVALGAGALTFVGYRARKDQVKSRLRVGLLVLRISAWVLIVVCLLQPVWRTPQYEEHPKRITLLVDESESMTFQDTPNGPTRMQRVKTLLDGPSADKGLLAEFQHSFQVRLEGFATASRTLDKTSELDPSGDRTDLVKPLAESLARLKGPDAGGLVLFSDGVDTTGNKLDQLRALGQKYKSAGIPIYAVGLGALPTGSKSNDIPDLAISGVRCRRTVSKDTLTQIDVDLTRTGYPEGRYTVRLTREGQTVKSQDVDLTSGKVTTQFSFLPAEQGFLEYRVEIDPQPGELVTANNYQSVGFMAFSRKLRVLYMEGSQYLHRSYFRTTWGDRWEHEFLKLALEEDPDVEVDVMLKEPQANLPRGTKIAKYDYPKTRKDLFQYDVIINSDIPYSHFTDEQIKLTKAFTYDHAGGFLMVAGWDAFGEGGYAGTEIDKMLPLIMNKNDTHADGQDFHWRITDKGLAHDIMKLDPDPKKNKEIWEMLNWLEGTKENPKPAFHGFSKTVQPKGSALVLAEIADEELEGAKGPMALIAIESAGKGRSMAFTTDCTGGWGASWEDAWGDDPRSEDRRNIYYKTFWKNAIRWLAAERMKAPNQLVQIETDSSIYSRGDTPEIRVRVLTEDYLPAEDATVKMTITGPDGGESEVTLYKQFSDQGEKGIYARKLLPTEVGLVGKYTLVANAAQKGANLGSDKALIQIRPAAAELRRLGQDQEALMALAESSGGVYLSFEEANKLTELLHKDTKTVRHFKEEDLWDNWKIFALLIGTLCLEWFLRKWKGLP